MRDLLRAIIEAVLCCGGGFAVVCVADALWDLLTADDDPPALEDSGIEEDTR